VTGPDEEALGGLREVQAAVAAACAAAGRDRDSVTLVAASKTVPADVLRHFALAGLRVYGENRVQEAVAKWPALQSEFTDLELSLIGPLQTNKVREAVATFDCIQSVDRPRLAAALARQMDAQGRKPRLLVQVNIAQEPQKAGVMPDQTDALVAYCREEQGLEVVGLMCIPPYESPSRPYFERMAELAERNELTELSMGMSQDYAEAIACGATQVRIGTAIFGARYYPPGQSPADVALARAAARTAVARADPHDRTSS
jgi:pyridoxal phosphate enzyme (YggS family)